MDSSTSPQLVHQMQSVDSLVYLVSRDQKFVSVVSQPINHFGYFVQHVRDFKSLPVAMADHRSVAILVDIPSLADGSY